MSIFCSHDWQREATTFAEPYSLARLVEGMLRGPEGVRTLERSVVGVTTVAFRCTKCGEFRVIEMLGKDTSNG